MTDTRLEQLVPSARQMHRATLAGYGQGIVVSALMCASALSFSAGCNPNTSPRPSELSASATTQPRKASASVSATTRRPEGAVVPTSRSNENLELEPECTSEGCDDSLSIVFAPPLARKGHYRFVTADVEPAYKCDFSLPGDLAAFTRCQQTHVKFGSSGELRALRLMGTPADVHLKLMRVSKAGLVVILDRAIQPVYKEVEHDDKGCSPLCRHAVYSVKFR